MSAVGPAAVSSAIAGSGLAAVVGAACRVIEPFLDALVGISGVTLRFGA